MHTRKSIKSIKKLRQYQNFIEDYMAWKTAKASTGTQLEPKNR